MKKNLLDWYDKNKRDLPWRIKSKKKQLDPFRILVSEIMLQQTTVGVVQDRYVAFFRKWPNLKEFSKARESQILRFWSGLGYYRRAINLLKCAKIIKKKYNYKVPNDDKNLSSLPGIGTYTCSAIQGIAFNKPVIAIDTNVERVVARVYGLSGPKSKIKKDIYSYAKNFIHKKRPGDMIQSLMDFGSIICKPKSPLCGKCCIRSQCLAYKLKLTDKIPFNDKKIINKPIKYASCYIITNIQNNKILLKKRKPSGLLPSMLEVPSSEWLKEPLTKKQIDYYRPIKKNYKRIKGSIIYSFSHFDLKIRIFFTHTNEKSIDNFRWYSIKNIHLLELPTIMKKILKEYIK